MRDSALDLNSQDAYLRFRRNSTHTAELVLELEEINKNKLLDSDLVNCVELRTYYLHRQRTLLAQLRDLFAEELTDVLQ